MNLSPRTKFVLMFILFALPITGSYLTYFFWSPDKTNNFGDLIRPVVALPQAPISIADGADAPQSVRERGMRGRWLIMTRDSGTCAQACRAKLYSMRQVRLLAGKELERVARVMLIDDGAALAPDIAQNFEGTAFVKVPPASWLAALPVASPSTTGTSDGRAYLYLVDPMGNVFMRYRADEDIKRISSDLRRVLKASQLGKEMEGAAAVPAEGAKK